jgi:hypothetical protein
MPIEHWKEDPEKEDYPAALSYLTLLVGRESARKMSFPAKWERPSTFRRALTSLRAAGLSLLAASDSEVSGDLQKVKLGEKLSPVLLVQGGGPLWIADGYHRVCASYHLDEKAPVPCRITSR